MATKKSTRRYSRFAAIALHAEANKSDPFAAKRIAMTIARDGHKEQQAIAEESQRILAARDAATKKAFREWKALQAVSTDPDGFVQHALSMSVFASRADYDAAKLAA